MATAIVIYRFVVLSICVHIGVLEATSTPKNKKTGPLDCEWPISVRKESGFFNKSRGKSARGIESKRHENS